MQWRIDALAGTSHSIGFPRGLRCSAYGIRSGSGSAQQNGRYEHQWPVGAGGAGQPRTGRWVLVRVVLLPGARIRNGTASVPCKIS